MKKLLIILALAALAPSLASATPLTCPDPIGSYSRQYYVDPASACVYGDGNLNGAGNDAFLALDPAAAFGYEWSFVGSTGGWNPAGSIPGLTITNSTGTSFEWSIDPTLFGPSLFTLAIKDGGDPKWAAFLVSGLSGTGGMVSRNGSISHVALYRTDTTVVPEPASMLLLGTGLLGLAGFVRRRRS